MAETRPPAFLRKLAEGSTIARAIWRHPGNRHRRVRGLASFLAWQFVKHVLNRPVVIRFHQKRLKCYPDSTSTSAALYFSGYPDYSTCYGISGDEVVQQLAAAGFACAIFNPDRRMLEYTSKPWLLGVQNVLAIANGRREFVEMRLRQGGADPADR